MINTWTIDLSTNRKIRDYYLKNNQPEYAKKVAHTESKYEGKTLELCTLNELQLMKKYHPDWVLISIFGEEIPAKDCDEDTRFGYVAAGRLVE